MAAADLEISVRRNRFDGYDMELRFTGPDDDAETVRNGTTLADDSLTELFALDAATEEYGRTAFRQLFADADLLAFLAQCRGAVAQAGIELRVRIIVDANAPELHRLRWEALRDEQGALLFTGSNIFVSRYISTAVYRPLRRRPRGAVRALVAIANPSDLADGAWVVGGRALPALHAEEEEQRTRDALGNIPTDVLRRGTDGDAVTLERIAGALRERRYDVLYLVCHGALRGREPFVLLENAEGAAQPVTGVELGRRLAELQAFPRLVVLASCQSGGAGEDAHSEDGGVLAALGPRLADSGIPAVLAMQGDVSMATVAAFMPVFFRELSEHGQIDRATALARGAVRDRTDAWVPVLFMRLKGGGLWYERGFDDAQGAFERWRAIVESIVSGRCTPILGPGLVEPYVGTRRELAHRLGNMYEFPLAITEREDLPQVAQYVAVEHAKVVADRRIVGIMCEEIQARYRSALTAEAREVKAQNESDSELARWHDELMRQAWQSRRGADSVEPHDALATLDLSLFLSTNVDDLLHLALREREGREPDVEVCRWNEQLAGLDSLFDASAEYKPTPKRPLVYHLFGKVSVEDSLVTTQDDYFDALIAMTGKSKLPRAVLTGLTNAALLFIGFQIDDWNFRVLFRFLMNLQGSQALRRHPHVAVQLDPEEQRFQNPRAAKRYLARYFGAAAGRISIYWGSADDFCRELAEHYNARQKAAEPALVNAGGAA